MTDKTKRMCVREMPEKDQPAYRAQHLGVSALTNAELLQLVTGHGYLDVMHRVMAEAGTLSDLAKMTDDELTDIKDIGPASALAIKAALELGRRWSLEEPEEKPQVRSPGDAAAVLMPQMRDKEQEHFVVVLMNTRNRIIDIDWLYKGSLNQSTVRVAEIFKAAVRKNAAAVLVAHNHPSGDPNPSPEDVAVTRDLVAAGQLLGIDVLDHLVIGDQRWISLRERGLGFEAVQ